MLSWGYTSDCLFPSQIALLAGLESFSLYDTSGKRGAQLSGRHLSALSQNLKSLFLYSTRCLEAFNELSLLRPSHEFRTLETLVLSSFKDVDTMNFKIPASVTELTLQSVDTEHGDLCLSCLPAGLTRLEFKARGLKIGDFTFPSTLLSLEMELHYEEDWTIIFDVLPREIQHISVPGEGYTTSLDGDAWKKLKEFASLKYIHFHVPSAFGVEEADCIPKSVEELDLVVVTAVEEESDMVEILKTLPPKLRRLDGIWDFNITSAIAQAMPRTLEHFSDRFILPEAVCYLPDSFKQIFIGIEFHEFEWDFIPHFPKKLERLYLPVLTQSLAVKMPSSLTYLQIDSNQTTLIGEIVQQLPRNLTRLVLNRAFSPISDLEDVLRALPPKLLTMNALGRPGERDITQLIPASSNSSSLIPRSLQTLELGCLDFSGSDLNEWILGLPRNLNTLKLFVDRLQPRAFTTVGCLSALMDLSITVLKTMEGGWAQCLDLTSLSRKLMIFSLVDLSAEFSASKGSNITNDNFVGAPLRLWELTLPDSPLLTRKVVAHFPHLGAVWFASKGSRTKPTWFKEYSFF